jgi:hypothetical protein
MIRQLLQEIAKPGSLYDEIISNIIQPNFHLKNELISELAISFLENEKKVNEVIDKGYFNYYFIRACINQIKSNTSPFHKNNRIKDFTFIENIEILDDTDIELKQSKEEKYIRIDRAYVKIPKTYFQEYLFQEYFTKNKTFRQIAKENDISHCLVFHEVTKVKNQLKNII